MFKKSVLDVEVRGKKCFVRVDFNVPQNQDGKITDDTRITAAIPTIKYLVNSNAKIVLCSHLGRPKGKFDAKYSLKPVADRLSVLLNKPVKLAADVIGPDADNAVAQLKDGEIVMLENVRFHKEEEENDKQFSKKLASYCDIFVNDAFGTAHRAHSSTAGIAEFCKTSVSGLLINKELEIIGGALKNPKRPFVVILGGAKVADKIGVITNLLDKADTLLIGGAMANTFIKAKGGDVGNSKVEDDKIEVAQEIIKQAENKVKLILPVDFRAAKVFEDVEPVILEAGKISDGYMALDIGEKTEKLFAEQIKNAALVIWNGPMGVFEFDNYAKGTFAVASALASSEAVTIVGGGDSAAAIKKLGFENKITHVSTGGGASLEYLEGKLLPGIECLDKKN